MKFARGQVGTVTRGQGEVTTLRVAGGGPGWQVAGTILGSQVSAIWCQVRVVSFGYGCGT